MVTIVDYNTRNHGCSWARSLSQRGETPELHPRGRRGKSQPAKRLRTIRQLENELGVKLFEQLGKKVALTEAWS